MTDSKAHAHWQGSLTAGDGTVGVESGSFGDLPVSWAARTNRAAGKTSPEELIAAAHSACYAMALSNVLAEAGNTADSLDVNAVCTFEVGAAGAAITRIALTVEGAVPGIDQAAFEKLAAEGEAGCPVSNALRGNVEIAVTATLKS
jgi:osmotically inducible protein OsmC